MNDELKSHTAISLELPRASMDGNQQSVKVNKDGSLSSIQELTNPPAPNSVAKKTGKRKDKTKTKETAVSSLVSSDNKSLKIKSTELLTSSKEELDLSSSSKMSVKKMASESAPTQEMELSQGSKESKKSKGKLKQEEEMLSEGEEPESALSQQKLDDTTSPPTKTKKKITFSEANISATAEENSAEYIRRESKGDKKLKKKLAEVPASSESNAEDFTKSGKYLKKSNGMKDAESTSKLSSDVEIPVIDAIKKKKISGSKSKSNVVSAKNSPSAELANPIDVDTSDPYNQAVSSIKKGKPKSISGAKSKSNVESPKKSPSAELDNPMEAHTPEPSDPAEIQEEAKTKKISDTPSFEPPNPMESSASDHADPTADDLKAVKTKRSKPNFVSPKEAPSTEPINSINEAVSVPENIIVTSNEAQPAPLASNAPSDNQNVESSVPNSFLEISVASDSPLYSDEKRVDKKKASQNASRQASQEVASETVLPEQAEKVVSMSEGKEVTGGSFADEEQKKRSSSYSIGATVSEDNTDPVIPEPDPNITTSDLGSIKNKRIDEVKSEKGDKSKPKSRGKSRQKSSLKNSNLGIVDELADLELKDQPESTGLDPTTLDVIPVSFIESGKELKADVTEAMQEVYKEHNSIQDLLDEIEKESKVVQENVTEAPDTAEMPLKTTTSTRDLLDSVETKPMSEQEANDFELAGTDTIKAVIENPPTTIKSANSLEDYLPGTNKQRSKSNKKISKTPKKDSSDELKERLVDNQPIGSGKPPETLVDKNSPKAKDKTFEIAKPKISSKPRSKSNKKIKEASKDADYETSSLLDQVHKQTKMSASRLSLANREEMEAQVEGIGSSEQVEKFTEKRSRNVSKRKESRTSSPGEVAFKAGKLDKARSKISMDIYSQTKSARDSVLLFNDDSVNDLLNDIEIDEVGKNTAANAKVKSRSKSKSNKKAKKVKEEDVSEILNKIQTEIKILESGSRMALNIDDGMRAHKIALNKEIEEKRGSIEGDRDSIQSLVERIEKETSGQSHVAEYNVKYEKKKSLPDVTDSALRLETQSQEKLYKDEVEKEKGSEISINEIPAKYLKSNHKSSTPPTIPTAKASSSSRAVSGISLSEYLGQDDQYQEFLLDTDVEKEELPSFDLQLKSELQQIVELAKNENVIPLFYDSSLKLYFSPELAPLALTGKEINVGEVLAKLYPSSRTKLSPTKNTALPFISTPLELDDIDPVFYDNKINFLWKDALLASHSNEPIPPSSLTEVQSVMYDKELKIFFLNELEYDAAAPVMIDGRVYSDPGVSYSKYLERQYPARAKRVDTIERDETHVDLEEKEEIREVDQTTIKKQDISKPAFRTGKHLHTTKSPGISPQRQKKKPLQTTIRNAVPYQIKTTEEAKVKHSAPFNSLPSHQTKPNLKTVGVLKRSPILPSRSRPKVKPVGVLKRPPTLLNARTRKPAGRSNVNAGNVPERYQASPPFPQINQQYIQTQYMQTPMNQGMQFHNPYNQQQGPPGSYVVYRQ